VKSSVHQEEAFALLSTIYSDADLSNLLVYGVEGEDYRVENGKAVRMEKNVKISVRESEFGNSFLTLPDLFDSAEKKTELWGTVEHLEFPAQHGISIYDEALLRKIIAINIMVQEEGYASALGGNSENWESDLEDIREQAARLGINEVVDEMNRRFRGQ